MMYEQEDRGERKLVYKCLHCGSAPEVADNPVVYHNEINAEAAGASASKFVNYGGAYACLSGGAERAWLCCMWSCDVVDVCSR